MDSAFAANDAPALIEALRSMFGQLSAAYVFGSAATGRMGKDSDIDLAVDIGRALSGSERWEASQKLAVSLNRDVDLIDFRVASDVLRHQILTTGRRIYARDPVAQSSYEAAVLSEYLDFVARRAPLIQDIAARGHVYAR